MSAETETRAGILARRNALLRAQEPERIRIDRPSAPTVTAPQVDATALDEAGKPKPAAVSVSVVDVMAAAQPGAKRNPSILDFWIEGRYAPYETAPGADDGELGVVYFGSDYKLGPDIMVGALAQFDRADEAPSESQGEVSAGGWMAGPYMSVRFGPGVILEGRAAWGTSGNGTGAVETETSDRSLLSGRLRGNRQIGAWTFAPSVGLSYIDETATRLSATDPQPIPGDAPGRLEVLPEIKRRFAVDSDTYIEPRATLGGYLSFEDMSTVTTIDPAASGAADLHMKAEAGFAVGVKDGLNLEAKGGVESSATATRPDTWTGGLHLNMPLGK